MKKIIIYILISIALLGLIFIALQTKKVSKIPYTHYRVYYDGELLGTIKSETELLNYIDENNTDYKEQYKVENIYKPENLLIKSYKTFEATIDDIESVYAKIKALAKFTLKGYQFTVGTGESAQTIYVLDEKVFNDAIDTVIRTFVDEKEYEDYINGETQDNKSMIENIYIKENISYKEAYISTDKKIYTDPHDLAIHFLYGEESKSKSYVVKKGDTIASVAFDNEINVNEFLLSNPVYTDESNMLAIGTEVTINPLLPSINVVVETYEVSEESKEYKVETTYDNEKNQNYFRVLRQGENGYDRIIRRVETINGTTTYALSLSKEELKPSISEIDVKGSKYVSSVGGYNWGWPTESGWYVIDRYRYRINPVHGGRELHTGLDITGTGCYSNIYAVNNGEVIMANPVDNNSYGLFVVVNHHNGYSTLYAHMISINVKVGDIVEKGQVIGLMGSTGTSTGCHVHFELWSGYPWANGYRLNPNVIPLYNK